MSEQVSGQPEGVTLLDAINDGLVPYPERMSYVRWLEWRKETGSRPVKRRDGRSTTSAQEVALWRTVMDFLHDMKDEDEAGRSLSPMLGLGSVRRLLLSRQLPALLLQQRPLPEPLGWLRLVTAR